VDYLLKPIEEEALRRALDKYKSIYKDPVLAQLEKINVLYKQIVNTYKTRFFVKTGNHFHSVAINEIQCFMIRERGTFSENHQRQNLRHRLLARSGAKAGGSEYFFPDQPQLTSSTSTPYRTSTATPPTGLGVKLKMLDHLDMIVSREKVADFKSWLDR
jgi:hypothetical protein